MFSAYPHFICIYIFILYSIQLPIYPICTINISECTWGQCLYVFYWRLYRDNSIVNIAMQNDYSGISVQEKASGFTITIVENWSRQRLSLFVCLSLQVVQYGVWLKMLKISRWCDVMTEPDLCWKIWSGWGDGCVSYVSSHCYYHLLLPLLLLLVHRSICSLESAWRAARKGEQTNKNHVSIAHYDYKILYSMPTMIAGSFFWYVWVCFLFLTFRGQ